MNNLPHQEASASVSPQRTTESFVSIPPFAYPPPFNTTRASHSVLSVQDLGKSRAFYVDCLGFTISDETADTLYLRGLAESCHHSLVLKRGAEAQAQRVGLRVFTEEDLDKAEAWFKQ